MLDRLRAAIIGRQIQVIVIGVSLIGGLLIAVWFVFLRTVYEPLFTGLRTMDAATITAELDQKKVPYRLADDDRTILVPSDLVSKTRLDIMSSDAPLKGTVGFELFNKSDMGITDFAQKIDYQRALQGELERTILTLDGVEMVRVHVSLGEDRLFSDDRVKPKASVTIRMARGMKLSRAAAQGITRLIAGAVAKLDPSDVVILDEFGRIVSSAPRIEPQSAPNSPVREQERRVEGYYEALIKAALMRANMPADMLVKVAADTWSNANFASSEQGAPAWNPAKRDFPLNITLSPMSALDGEKRQAISALVTQAIATDSRQPDTIGFEAPGVGEPVPPAKPLAPVEAQRRPSPAAISPADDSGPDLVMELGAALGLVLVMIAGPWLLLRRLRGSRRLTAKQRGDFVARLRKTLEEREARAVPNS